MRILLRPATVLLATSLLPLAASAQDSDSSVFDLSPFEVAATGTGYTASNDVSATRINMPIIDIAQNIQVLTKELLDDTGSYSLDTAMDYAAGVTKLENSGTFTIRGFTMRLPYRNGLRTWNNPEVANVDRVVIIKGPASLLYGNNEPGGVINYVTKKPLEQPFYETTLTVGSWDFYRVTGDFTGPVYKDKVLYRLNVAYQNNGSWRDYADYEQLFITPALTFKPFKGTRITAELEYFDRFSHPAARLPDVRDELPRDAEGNWIYYNPDDPYLGRQYWVTRMAPVPYEYNYNGPDAFNDWEAYFWFLDIEQKLADGWWLKFGGRYQERQENNLVAGDTSVYNEDGLHWQLILPRGPNLYETYDPAKPAQSTETPVRTYNPPPFAFRRWGSSYTQTDFDGPRATLDLTGEFDNLGFLSRIVVGAEYFKVNQYNFSSTASSDGAVVPNFGLFVETEPPFETINRNFVYLAKPIDFSKPATEIGPDGKQILNWRGSYGATESHSYYGQWNGTFLGGRMTVQAGARWDHLEFPGDSDVTDDVPGSDPDRYHRLSPQVGVNAQIIEGLNIFALYSESFTPLFQADPNTGRQVPPSMGRGKEVGFKTALLGGRFSSTLSYFDIVRRNETRFIRLNPSDSELTYVPYDMRVKGIDWDITYTFNDNLQFTGGIAWLPDAYVSNDEVFDLQVGTRLGNTPEWQFTMWSKYSFTEGDLDGLSLSLGVIYKNERKASDAPHLLEFYFPEYYRFDGAVKYKTTLLGKDVEFNLNLKNLLNRRYIEGRFVPADPRAVMLSVKTVW